MSTASKPQATEDWQVFALGDLLKFSNGINADKSAYGAGIPFANVLEVITHQSLTSADISGRITLTPKLLARYQVRRNDILFNRTSETQDEVGLVSVYLGDEPIVFGGFVFRGQPLNDELDPNFAKYALRSHAVRNQVMARGQGGIRANIGQRDLKSVIVSLPRLAEQGAISNALDDVSGLISHLERLIAKKEAIKQGMMQQLLTGKIRLPGFTKPWADVSAGDVGTFRGGSGFPVRHQGKKAGMYPFFKVSDMNTKGNALFMRAANHYINEPERKRMGAVVMPKEAIVLAKVGAAVFLERKRILSQPSCIDNNLTAFTLDSSKADVRFVHYSLTNFPIASLVATTAMPSLNGGQLRSIPLALPADLDEQRAIGRVLGDCDNEVDAARRRLAKAIAVKQGMMRELLTGRTRLPVAESA